MGNRPRVIRTPRRRDAYTPVTSDRGVKLTIRTSTGLALAVAALVAAGCGSNSNDRKSSGNSDSTTSATPASGKPMSSSAAPATTHLSNAADGDGGLYF